MSINRREAIRNILIASGSTVFLSSFSMVDVIDLVQDQKLVLSKKYLKYLSQISESLLPIADVSEKIGDAASFVVEQLNHSYQPEEIQQFATGFDQFLLTMKEARIKVKASEAEQMIPAVKEILRDKAPESDLVFFINTTKHLSIRNLRQSEYYITDFYEYKLIPGKYNGCQEVTASN